VLTASRAPYPIASKTFEAFPPTVAVTTRMRHGDAAMMRRVASVPSITGRIKSIKITSGVSAAHFSTASAPFRATQAIS
jgi:hypothetical protein